MIEAVLEWAAFALIVAAALFVVCAVLGIPKRRWR